MKLSVIIPIYNVEKYLSRCVESVLSQEFDANEMEILLINDGSTDGSGEIAKKFSQIYDCISYFEQENKGLGGARNTGIRNAKGEYILFLDSDDWITENSLKPLLNKTINNQLDLMIYDTQRVFTSGKILKSNLQYLSNHLYTGKELILERTIEILPCSNLYKTEILKENKIFFVEGVFYEDADFYINTILHSKRIMYCPDLIYHYFYNDQSITVNTNKNHLNKKVNDYGRAMIRLNKIKENIREKKQQEAIQFIIEKYQYWLVKMIFENDLDFSMITQLFRDLKKEKMFPFYNSRYTTRNDRAQFFYINHFIKNTFFFKNRYKGAVWCMKINKRLGIM